MQRRFRWSGHAARRPEGELIKDLLLPTLPRTWRRRAGGQLKTWATTIKADLEPPSGPRVFGHARWRKDWVKVSSELTQDRLAWGASIRDVVNSIIVMPAQPAPGDCRHEYKSFTVSLPPSPLLKLNKPLQDHCLKAGQPIRAPNSTNHILQALTGFGVLDGRVGMLAL